MATHSIELQNSVVTLRPLAETDAPQLLDAAGSNDTFRYFSKVPTPWTPEGMRDYCAFLIAHPTTYAFTVRDVRTGAAVGSTTFCDLRPENRTVEIGWTWYAPSSRGTPVNPSCKRLLLEHAFSGDLFGSPAIRVCLKTDARNAHSRGAIAKLGALPEGIIRSQVIMPDGHRRDSAYFSIIEDEWPSIRDRLDERLASHESA